MQRRLAGVIVKYGDADTKKPKFKRQNNPVIIMDPFFLLPQKLLDKCVEILPVSNTTENAISLEEEEEPRSAKADGSIDTVHIKDVGIFTRSQIETFKRVSNFKASVQLGLDMHKWLLEDGLPSLPADYHDLANEVASEILRTYPFKQIAGLPPLPDFQYTMLYRATPPTWFSDAAIRAFCERLVKDYPGCQFAGILPAAAKTKRTRNNDESPVDVATRDRILQLVGESGVDTVFLPLNFLNAHWCCVVVKVQQQRIYYYDPLNQSPYMNAAFGICIHLQISGLIDYEVIPQNNPIQFDAFSCGVYVCWMFIRQGTTGLCVDMSANVLSRRRFELFYFLLTGRLLPVQPPPPNNDDDTEEKSATPQQDCAQNGTDLVPPTQVAQ